MHGFANLSTLHDQCRLYALTYGNQIVMHGRYGKQRRDECTLHSLFNGRTFQHLIRQDDIVEAIVYRLFRVLAKLIQCFLQVFSSLRSFTFLELGFEYHVQFDGLKPLIPDVAENVELRVVQYRMRQSHHLTIRFVWI